MALGGITWSAITGAALLGAATALPTIAVIFVLRRWHRAVLRREKCDRPRGFPLDARDPIH